MDLVTTISVLQFFPLVAIFLFKFVTCFHFLRKENFHSQEMHFRFYVCFVQTDTDINNIIREILYAQSETVIFQETTFLVAAFSFASCLRSVSHSSNLELKWKFWANRVVGLDWRNEIPPFMGSEIKRTHFFICD